MPLATLLLCAALGASPAIERTVCIDPGHPSEVGRGTTGKRVSELQVAWEVGSELGRRLRARGYRVVLTKSSMEEMVTNRRRAEIANAQRASLMVRLHCDAAAGSGFAVYYPTRKGTAADRTVGPSEQVLKRTKPIATRFHDAMARSLSAKLKDNGLKSDLATNVGSRQGALTGSIFSEVPVLLVEMVVLTNRSDEAFIVSRSGREAMVRALVAGVEAAVPR